MKYKSRSYRIDDEVAEAIKRLPISLNQFLRSQLIDKPTIALIKNELDSREIRQELARMANEPRKLSNSVGKPDAVSVVDAMPVKLKEKMADNILTDAPKESIINRLRRERGYGPR